MPDIVLVSGGFDPLHSGHISLIKDSSKHGNIVILLNSDKWLINKKGKFFLPYKEREIIMLSIKNVIIENYKNIFHFKTSLTYCFNKYNFTSTICC